MLYTATSNLPLALALSKLSAKTLIEVFFYFKYELL